MTNLFDVWLALGRQPTYGDMALDTSRFGAGGYAHRYGSWTAALLRFQDWIDAQGGARSDPAIGAIWSEINAEDCKPPHALEGPRARPVHMRCLRILASDGL